MRKKQERKREKRKYEEVREKCFPCFFHHYLIHERCFKRFILFSPFLFFLSFSSLFFFPFPSFFSFPSLTTNFYQKKPLRRKGDSVNGSNGKMVTFFFLAIFFLLISSSSLYLSFSYFSLSSSFFSLPRQVNVFSLFLISIDE